MKGVIKTVVLVMMVSILFGMSVSAAAQTSKNVTHHQGKKSAGKKSLKNKKNRKKRKAAGNAASGKRAKRIKKSERSIIDIADGSAADRGSKPVKAELEGKVIEQLPNAMFRVELSDGSTVVAYISGKLRNNFIRIRFGDRVLVETSPDNPGKGRIIWRYKK